MYLIKRAVRFELQGRIGTTNLRVTILKQEIAGGERFETAEEE